MDDNLKLAVVVYVFSFSHSVFVSFLNSLQASVLLTNCSSYLITLIGCRLFVSQLCSDSF